MALIRFSLRSSKYRNNSSGSVGSLACCNASMIAAFSPTHRPPDGLHGTVGFPDVPFQVSDIGLDSFLLHVGNGCSHMDGGGFVNALSGIGEQVKALGAPGGFQITVDGIRPALPPDFCVFLVISVHSVLLVAFPPAGRKPNTFPIFINVVFVLYAICSI